VDAKKIFFKIAAYFISIICLYFTFNDIDIEIVFNYISVVDIYCLIAAAGCNFCFYVVRSFYQINNLHYFKKVIPFSESLTSISISQFYNVILPAKMGEFIRCYFLSKRLGMKKISVLSYIMAEKVMDVLVILTLLFLIIFFLIQGNVELVNATTFLAGAIFVLSVFLIVYLRFSRDFMLFLKRIIPDGIFSIINTINDEILTGLKFFKTKRQIAKSILLLMLSWICVLAIFGLLSYPYLELLDLPFYSCLVFMVFSALSLSVPSAPAGIGVMHYALFLAVNILGGDNIDHQTNIVAALVISTHFFTMLFDVLLGGGITIAHGLTSKDREIWWLNS